MTSILLTASSAAAVAVTLSARTGSKEVTLNCSRLFSDCQTQPPSRRKPGSTFQPAKRLKSGSRLPPGRQCRGPGSRLPRLPPNSALLAVVGRQVLFLRVFLRRRLDHRPHDFLVRLDPVRDELPGLPVPLKDAGAAAAGMVLAGHLGRPQQPFEAELLERIGGQVEVFETPADLLAGQWLLAELALRGAHRLDREQRIDDAAIVKDGADILA